MQQQIEDRGWRLNTPPQSKLDATWPAGRLETARRSPTAEVEGRLHPERHTVMVTLKGGASRHRFRNDDGFSYDGRDTLGMVSFLPAGCGRDLTLHDVAWEWAAIAIEPESMGRSFDARSFLTDRDDFIHGMAEQMSCILRQDGVLDQTYSSSMGLALIEYLGRRHSGQPQPSTSRYGLTARQLRETRERIEGLLSGPIAIVDLAAPLGISEGHFFRAFRGATGQSPLQAISARRMDHAARLLTGTDLGITEIAARCGIESPSYFARLFRASKGVSPSVWRRL
jgi:AraC family transcriptional regulator